MIKAGNGYIWKVQRGQTYTDFDLCKLMFGFIPPLVQTYHKEAGYITVTIENTSLSAQGKFELIKILNDTFSDFLKRKSDYETITKMLS